MSKNSSIKLHFSIIVVLAIYTHNSSFSLYLLPILPIATVYYGTIYLYFYLGG